MAVVRTALCLLALTTMAANADIFLHNPRGSNNRFRGDNNNQARLFDSQNNSNGGYGWGPTMTYYEGSVLSVELVAQHGCGAAYGLNCEVILQYMCGSEVRDGVRDDPPPRNIDSLTPLEQLEYGYHEPVSFYNDCENRLRNSGLFIADQNIGASAVNTRQNDGATRRGFECDEERDYYPYWHPSPWKDIAIFTSKTSRCPYYRSSSQNVSPKGHCVSQNSSAIWGFAVAANDRTTCLNSGNSWISVPSWGLPAPDCLAAPNLHPTDDLDKGITYRWTVPSQLVNQGNCVLRVRYNVSSADFNGWEHVDTPGAQMIDFSFNGANSPLLTNPTISIGRNLSFTVNTDQYGRTFEDRSHTFKVASRPQALGSTGTIWNLNVRGRRGNLVQAYPALQYAFVPQFLEINRGDFVHYQWTGCDTWYGAVGDGRDGTDRSNIVQIESIGKNTPMPMGSQTMFPSLDVALTMATLLNSTQRKFCNSECDLDCCRTQDQLQLVAYGGCPNVPDYAQNEANQIQNCNYLSLAGPYFNHFPIQYSSSGRYYYMCTRNNSFSNRGQKGVLSVA